MENHQKLENEEGRIGNLGCLLFIQREKAEAIAFLGISLRKLLGKGPNYPGSRLPIPKYSWL